jgi:hypothetical protein
MSIFVIVEISCNNDRIGIKSRIACDKAMYSASVVLNAISDWSLDAHKTGQLANKMT